MWGARLPFRSLLAETPKYSFLEISLFSSRLPRRDLNTQNMSYAEDTDVHLEQQDYTNVDEYYEDEDDDFSFDVRDTVNPLLTVAAPRGEEYIFDDDFSRKKLSWGDRFSWLIGGGFITGMHNNFIFIRTYVKQLRKVLLPEECGVLRKA